MLAECLAGIRVLDLTQYIPGPLATQWLSDLGASVIKVEPPSGDPMRTMGPLDEDGTTPFYKLANRNKTVVRMDLKTLGGKQAFAHLLKRADILVEAYRPGVLARLGFGPEILGSLNPRLIHCSISGYGGTGPHAPVAGHDITYSALSGVLWNTGTAERPAVVFPPQADHAGSMLAVMAVMGALMRRGVTGKGARLDISLAEAALSWMGGVMTAARREKITPRDADYINGGAAFYHVYATKDGRFVALAAMEEKFWEKFCQTVNRPDWLSRQAEALPQTALIAELEALFLTRDRDAWTALLCPVDCCFEPVLDPLELPDHPQWQARGFIQTEVDEDRIVEVLLPILMNGKGVPTRKPFREISIEAVLETWEQPQ